MSQKNSNNFFENPYFTYDELKCKGTGVLQLAPGFLGELLWLRQLHDRPMVVTSCCRSPEHNVEIGGNPRSLHMTVNDHWNTGGTMAVDILDRSEEERIELMMLARDLGWSVGFGNGFLHLDKRIQIGLPRTDFDY